MKNRMSVNPNRAKLGVMENLSNIIAPKIIKSWMSRSLLLAGLCVLFLMPLHAQVTGDVLVVSGGGSGGSYIGGGGGDCSGGIHWTSED